MRAPASLQARLALSLGAALTALWAVAAAMTAAELRHEMNEVFDSTLRAATERILPLAVVEIVNREQGTGAQRLVAARPGDDDLRYIVRDAEGGILLISDGGDPADFPPYQGRGFHRTDSLRLYEDAALGGTIRITVAEPLWQRAEAARGILMRLALPVLAVLPLTLAMVVLLVRLAFAGLRRFRERLARRGAHDLSPVPTAGLPAEIVPAAGTLNMLLRRLEVAFAAERSFASHAAHELRTPLAGAIAQAQRLGAETAEPATAARVSEIETTLKRLTRTAERLLQLARAEGGRLRVEQAGDLRAVARLVAEDVAGAQAASERLRLDLPERPVMSHIDADVAAILCRNLIDNALRHGAAGGDVIVSLSADGVLTVVNDGPVVAPEVLAHLTDRFERAGTGTGSGLGLAIAAAIAERLETPLTLRSPAPGAASGFSASISLSLAGDDHAPARGPAAT